MRMRTHPILGDYARGEPVTFYFNGQPVQGLAHEPIAVALAALDQWRLRASLRHGEPRGLFCGMGHCFECRVTVDGVPNVRACLTPIRAGMRVEG